MFLAEAGPPIPPAIAPDVIIGIGLLATFLVLYGGKFTYDYSLGALLRLLGRVLNIDAFLFSLDLGGVFRKMDAEIQSAFASGLLATETAFAKWWYVNKEVIEYAYGAVAWLAHQSVGAFDSLVHGTIPQAVTVVTRPIANDLGKLEKALRAQAASLETEIVKRAHALEAELTHDFGIAKRGIDYVRGTAVPQVWHWIRGAEAEIEALKRWEVKVGNRRLTRLERLLGVGVISGIAIAALSRVFPYWQCSNVRRFLRGVCRSPLGSLDWLFALAALVVVALKPRQIAELGQEAVGTLDSLFRTMQGHPLYSAPVTDWQPSGRYAPRGT